MRKLRRRRRKLLWRIRRVVRCALGLGLDCVVGVVIMKGHTLGLICGYYDVLEMFFVNDTMRR